MSIRVIAGRAKGRRLQIPATPGLRPTGDRLREALFSSLGSRIAGAVVLDLYAGTGAMGIEALSRGAASATFVDRDRRAVAAVRANLAATGFSERASVVCANAEVFARQTAGPTFDLILADPPYDDGVPGPVIQALWAAGRFASDASVVFETAARMLPAAPPAGFVVSDSRRYGDCAFVVFRQAA